jgi:hypothetical protein
MATVLGACHREQLLALSCDLLLPKSSLSRPQQGPENKLGTAPSLPAPPSVTPTWMVYTAQHRWGSFSLLSYVNIWSPHASICPETPSS